MEDNDDFPKSAPQFKGGKTKKKRRSRRRFTLRKWMKKTFF
jgi:hypothetical protein